ncbi:hypothetical protein GCM10009613_53720 [Pseudonocardia kongjuensis]|uniref:Uncharacterized protein n=2 Tax=Pseudonocardia kongjuensis TaxID=102227 RepID=A0ABP4IVG6_9PSEU
MRKVLAQGGCVDGDCPAFWIDDETGTVTVRGFEPGSNTRERDVTIPVEVWDRLVAQLPR